MTYRPVRGHFYCCCSAIKLVISLILDSRHLLWVLSIAVKFSAQSDLSNCMKAWVRATSQYYLWKLWTDPCLTFWNDQLAVNTQTDVHTRSLSCWCPSPSAMMAACLLSKWCSSLDRRCQLYRLAAPDSENAPSCASESGATLASAKLLTFAPPVRSL